VISAPTGCQSVSYQDIGLELMNWSAMIRSPNGAKRPEVTDSFDLIADSCIA